MSFVNNLKLNCFSRNRGSRLREKISSFPVFCATPRFFPQGISSTVIAYGTSGSGKTFTLFGTLDHPGMVLCALHDIFAHIASYRSTSAHRKPRTSSPGLLSWAADPGRWRGADDSLQYEFSVRCSYVEIRRNSIVDLLKCASDFATTDLLPTLSILRGSPRGEAVVIEGLSEQAVTHVGESVRRILK